MRIALSVIARKTMQGTYLLQSSSRLSHTIYFYVSTVKPKGRALVPRREACQLQKNGHFELTLGGIGISHWRSSGSKAMYRQAVRGREARDAGRANFGLHLPYLRYCKPGNAKTIHDTFPFRTTLLLGQR